MKSSVCAQIMRITDQFAET